MPPSWQPLSQQPGKLLSAIFIRSREVAPGTAAMSTSGQQAPRGMVGLGGACECEAQASLEPTPARSLSGAPWRSVAYLGIGQVPESLAGLQRLQELYNGRDATVRQEHSAQAAETAEDLL